MRDSEETEGAGRHEPSRGPVLVQVLFAAAAMTAGALVYVWDRAPSTVYLLPDAQLFESAAQHFGPVGYLLPSFAHVYVFAILTGLCLRDTRRNAILACTAWLLADVLLELLQRNDIAESVATRLPAWFQSIPLLENVGPYFQLGTFDPKDLLALLTGALAAFATLRLSRRRHE
ncbi:MAG: hypothetical protein ACWGPN_05590 [Gammaproteobacteria bacterium]